jgi:hypothetical protein
VVEGRKPELVGGGLLRSVVDWKGLKELRDSGEKVLADERILGGSEFVKRAFRESEEGWHTQGLPPPLPARPTSTTVVSWMPLCRRPVVMFLHH